MLLIYRLLAIVLALSISRWMLYLFNTQYFHQLNLGQALDLYFYGMRFDLPVVITLNLIVIIYYCLPSKIIYRKGLQRFIDIFYVAVNSIAILLNFIDIVCFHIFAKHITIGFLKVLVHSEEVSFVIIRQMFFDYWYLFLIFILFVLVLNVVARHTRLKAPKKDTDPRWHQKQSICLAAMLLFSFIGWRGGFQKEPISIRTAMRHTDPQNASILLNTPFCLLNTQENALVVQNHPDALDFSPIHYELDANRFLVSDSLAVDTIPDNVVVIILKNFGQEMVGYYNPDRCFPVTPFLDSLLSNSLTFNGMANSRRSLEVLPSILAGIPSLMENDFVRSPYADNEFDAFGQHLQKRGYKTIFMHGGNNGVQGFDQFSSRAGFGSYFGRIEYADDSDYD